LEREKVELAERVSKSEQKKVVVKGEKDGLQKEKVELETVRATLTGQISGLQKEKGGSEGQLSTLLSREFHADGREIYAGRAGHDAGFGFWTQ
jgi:hypothetical protein